MKFKKQLNLSIHVGIIAFLFGFASTPLYAADLPCPIPGVEETKIELCLEGQTEIPRGNCLEICIRGKMEKDSLSLSLDQTVGSGFHFDMDNGPTSIETTENRIMICSDATSCGSASILVTQNGVTTEIGSVRSNEGKWVYVKTIQTECPFTGEYTTRESSPDGVVLEDELIFGKWRIRETKMIRYNCNLYIGWGCDCGKCGTKPHCIQPVSCPPGYDKVSPFCCRKYPSNDTVTIYCILTIAGPYLHEWRCN